MGAKVYAICNQKGGSGKTTTAAALAQAAAYKGLHVLAVDLDPQGHLTLALGGQAKGSGDAYDLLNGGKLAEQVQATRQGVELVASSPNLAALTTSQGSARRLQKALAGAVKRYDAIIIDTPTQPGELLFNALQAATVCVVTVKADVLSLQGFYQFVQTSRAFRASNPEMKQAGLVVTAYDRRSNYAKHLLETIKEKAEALGFPFLGIVRPAVAIQEAQGFGESLFEYAPKSKPAQDYLAIFDKLF